MKKADAEQAIRHLCRVWVKEENVSHGPTDHPNFLKFKTWLGSNGYGHYLDFRSVAGADHDAEMWFDQELNQTWRN